MRLGLVGEMGGKLLVGGESGCWCECVGHLEVKIGVLRYVKEVYAVRREKQAGEKGWWPSICSNLKYAK